MKRSAGRVVALGVLLGSACGHPTPKAPGAFPGEVLPQRAARFKAGAARADITLPPGPSTFGHGHDSRASDGYWTRLYCRAFYFEAPETKQNLAIVPCELPAMSGLLQRQVAELVNEGAPAEKQLHASRIMLTAVHTHAGFGHYFGAAQYTSIFSSRLPGYDPRLMREVAERIARAIKQARDEAEPAQLGWRHARDFWCFTRNRSLAAYQLNRPAYVAGNPPECASGTPELEAIDPALDVLRIDTLPEAAGVPSSPIGSLSFFAMHPTVLSSTNQMFGGDVAGVISRGVERELRQSCPPAGAAGQKTCDPLHAVVNTNEGDMAPLWSRGDIEEAIEIGERIADFVWQRHPEPKDHAATPVLDSRYFEENIRDATFEDAGQRFHTCGYGQFGLGAARGAQDHPTSVAPLAWFGSASPADFEASCCQSPKRALLGPISAVSRGKGSFPSDLPLAVARIDDTLIAFVPGEMTVTAGHRLKTRITTELQAFPDAPRNTVIAGLSNEYIEYVTTEEEYQLQAYEGASTLYGPNTSRYFTNRMGLLARAMFDPQLAQELAKSNLRLGEAREMTFAFGPEVSRLPEPSDDTRERKTLGTCRMPEPRVADEPPRFCMYWQDRDLGAIELRTKPGMPWIRIVADDAARSSRVCASGASGEAMAIDDRGYEFQTRVHEELDHGWVWSTLFSPRPETWQELSRSVSRIRVQGSPAIESASFSATCLPPRCTVRQARLCTAGVRTTQWKGLVHDE
jgi:neutral ceramidase